LLSLNAAIGSDAGLKTILAALDLEGEGAVLARAAHLATEHGAWLVLLHVIESEMLSHAVAVSGHTESDLQDQLRRQAVAQIEKSLAEIGRTRRTDVRIEFGSPHEVIAQVAGERSADLVVLGPSKSLGKSLREKVLGSTADRVIRTSPAPALVVKTEAPEPYRQIVVAVDFSPQSVSAAKEARRLAPNATIQFVHVVDFPLTFEQAQLRIGTPQTEMDRYRLARATTARNELLTFARDVSDVDTTATRILEGEPGPVLVRLAKSKRVDLLALGPHGRGVVLQALLGSVTQRILREAACDVLVASTRQ
jgi:universal stress protein E